MASPTTKRRTVGTPPSGWLEKTGSPPWLIAVAALGLVGLVVSLLYVLGTRNSGESATNGAGLPRTSDYHSLLVAPDALNTLVLGTHQGLFSSADGGRTWKPGGLTDNDAMNLAQPSADIVWAAGHNVLSQSRDGGTTWQQVRPTGLPSLDVHGFAVDPRNPSRVFAAIAGEGLFRSADGGKSFALVSRQVGPSVMALTILPSGRLLAGDMSTNTLASSNDGGVSWKSVVRAGVMGLAVDPSDGKRVLAAGPGVLLSTDGGASWRRTLELDAGAGPIAWSKGEPGTAFVVGFDRSLYRSDDAGETWTRVTAGEGS